MSFDQIVMRLENPKPYKPNKSQFINAVRSTCPVCGGAISKLNVSLSVTGKVTLHCFGGCSFLEIVNALNLDASDFFPPDINFSATANANMDTIKGWDWWSLTSALDSSADLLMNNFMQLTIHLPQEDPARRLMVESIRQIKDLSDRLKYGKKGGAIC
jgi:hypothetical protein